MAAVRLTASRRKLAYEKGFTWIILLFPPYIEEHLQACTKQIYDWTLIHTNTVNKHTIYICTYNIKLIQRAYAYI